MSASGSDWLNTNGTSKIVIVFPELLLIHRLTCLRVAVFERYEVEMTSPLYFPWQAQELSYQEVNDDCPADAKKGFSFRNPSMFYEMVHG